MSPISGAIDSSGPAAPLRILVIDSDLDAQFRVYPFLKKQGYRVQSAGSTREALASIGDAVPDMVICSVRANGVDGVELCSRLKSTPATAAAWFIALEEEGAGPDAEAFWFTQGADGFAVSPVPQEDLLARIRAGERTLVRSRGHEMARRRMYREIDVLLVQEGGCAPGYNPVTAFLTEELETHGRRVYCAREGFRSLVRGEDEDFVRLVYDQEEYRRIESIPGVVNAAFLTEAAGGQFRSERYDDFREPEKQFAAARVLAARNVRVLVTIGGNGTLKGTRDLAGRLAETTQNAFVPVTVDSDVAGTECIGQHTGVEVGADKLRRYMADARTHKRIYLIEMMGARGGFHALYSSLGARAHLAVLPGADLNPRAVMEALNRKDYAVVAVAEGYGADDPERRRLGLHAAAWFAHQLESTGITSNKKIVSEPFSRDLRGAIPNNLDMVLARRMARGIADAVRDGRTAVMPAVRGEDLSYIPFWKIDTENRVSEDLARLADRLTHGFAAPRPIPVG
ncbi:MAG: 6-phosphofructokinase [Candidatus Eisenbacteria bacterium]|nr:6-phosphofructokinase [Candidatus Eisenbacteria bacterium]